MKYYEYTVVNDSLNDTKQKHKLINVHNRYTMATRLPMFWDVYSVDKELKNWEGERPESFLRRMFFPYATHLAARWLTTLCFAF